jgi:hypothetical protein
MNFLSAFRNFIYQENEVDIVDLLYDNSEWAKAERLKLEERKYINDVLSFSQAVGECGSVRVSACGHVTSGTKNKLIYSYDNSKRKTSRCQYCGTRYDDIEKHCSACGAPT